MSPGELSPDSWVLHHSSRTINDRCSKLTTLIGGRLIPGLVVFSLLGYCGQGAFNRLDAWQLEKAQTPSKAFTQRIAESKWIPLRHLSDQEYRGILNEKLLSIEAEIALLDEKIEELAKTRPSSNSANS